MISYWYRDKQQPFIWIDTLLRVKEIFTNTLTQETFIPPHDTSYLVIAVSQGQGMVKIDSQQHFLTSGQVLLGFPNDAITLKAIEQLNFSCIVMTGTIAENLLRRIEGSQGKILSVTSLFPLTETLEQAKKISNPFQASCLGYTFLVNLFQNVTFSSTGQFPPLVKEALLKIENQYPYLYGVEDLAKELGVTKNHLIRIFTQTVGVSPGQYLIRRRIEGAKDLMHLGEDSMEAIAAACGFSNGNYFSKVFKKLEGCTPTEYRKRQKKTQGSPKHNNIYIM